MFRNLLNKCADAEPTEKVKILLNIYFSKKERDLLDFYINSERKAITQEVGSALFGKSRLFLVYNAKYRLYTKLKNLYVLFSNNLAGLDKDYTTMERSYLVDTWKDVYDNLFLNNLKYLKSKYNIEGNAKYKLIAVLKRYPYLTDLSKVVLYKNHHQNSQQYTIK
jgi:hypothetical protein